MARIDAQTLPSVPMMPASTPWWLLMAAQFGTVRLLDNIALDDAMA